MSEQVFKIRAQLCELLTTIKAMRENISPYQAIRAVFEIGCDYYGKANIIEYADGIGQLQLLRGLI